MPVGAATYSTREKEATPFWQADGDQMSMGGLLSFNRGMSRKYMITKVLQSPLLWIGELNAKTE